MNIADWFDVNNIEHLKAYKHLEDTGFWPKNFLPEEMEMPALWGVSLAHKLADAYIDMMLRCSEVEES